MPFLLFIRILECSVLDLLSPPVDPAVDSTSVIFNFSSDIFQRLIRESLPQLRLALPLFIRILECSVLNLLLPPVDPVSAPLLKSQNFSTDISKRFIRDSLHQLWLALPLFIRFLECFVLNLLLAPVHPAFGSTSEIQEPAFLGNRAQLGLSNLNNYHFPPRIDRRLTSPPQRPASIIDTHAGTAYSCPKALQLSSYCCPPPPYASEATYNCAQRFLR